MGNRNASVSLFSPLVPLINFIITFTKKKKSQQETRDLRPPNPCLSSKYISMTMKKWVLTVKLHVLITKTRRRRRRRRETEECARVTGVFMVLTGDSFR
jgi:hypothetical protein